MYQIQTLIWFEPKSIKIALRSKPQTSVLKGNNTYAHNPHKNWFVQTSAKNDSYLNFRIFAKCCLGIWTKIQYIFIPIVLLGFAIGEGVQGCANDFRIYNCSSWWHHWTGAVCSKDLSSYNFQGACTGRVWGVAV